MKLKNILTYILEKRFLNETLKFLLLKKNRSISSKNVNDVTKYLIKRFRISLGYYPSIENPLSFNEKILWTKLHWRSDLARKCADKLALKDYLLDCGLSDFIPKTIKCYSTSDDFINDVDNLPSNCVIKTNHDSGSVFIKTKNLSKKALSKGYTKIVKGFNNGPYTKSFEWVYENIEKRIFVEEKIGDSVSSIPDYKFFCFNGEPCYVFVASNRNGLLTKFDYFDMDWNWLKVKNVHYHAKNKPLKPYNLNEMINLCRIVSKPFSQVRVDLYSYKDRLYIGELTFFHYAGDQKFSPRAFDYEMGSKWNLLTIPKNEVI